MITKFKIFESKSKPLYNIDDYVYVVQPNGKNKKYYRANVKIIDIEHITHHNMDFYSYLVDDGGQDNDIGIVVLSSKRMVKENEIKRKLTPEEIEQYEIMKIGKKYNL